MKQDKRVLLLLLAIIALVQLHCKVYARNFLTSSNDQDSTKYILADSLMRQGEFLKTIELLQANFTLSEDSKFIQVGLANILSEAYWRSGQLKKAEQVAMVGIDVIESFHDHDQFSRAKGDLLNNLCIAKGFSGHFDTALEIGYRSLEVYKKDSIDNLPRIGTLCTRLGYLYSKSADQENAGKFFRQALKINIKIHGPESLEAAGILNNLGILYTSTGEYDKSITYFEKALNSYRKLYRQDHPLVANALFNIGVTYYKQNKRAQALEHYFFALNIFEKKPESYYLEISNAYNNIGTVYSDDKNHEESISWHTKALNLRTKVLGASHPNTAFSYNNLGITYRHISQDSLALIQFLRALEIRLENLQEPNPDIARSYMNVANCYRSMKRYDLALDYFKRSIENNLRSVGEYHPSTASIYNYTARTHLELKNFNEGIYCIRQAVRSNLGKEMEVNRRNTNLIKKAKDLKELLLSLTLEAKLLFARDKHGEVDDDLSLALQSILFGEQVIKYIRKSQSRLEDRLNWSELSNELYEVGVMLAYELWKRTGNSKYIEQAFFFSERDKASILIQNLNDQNARHFENLPDQLLYEEEKTKAALSFYKSKVMESRASENGYDTTKLMKYETHIFQLNQSLDSLVDYIERSYPKYYDLKYRDTVISVNEIRAKLKADEALLEYFEADTALYVFCITKKDFNLVQSVETKRITDLVKNIKSLSIRSNQEPEDFIVTSYTLYNTLLKIPLSNLDEDITKLILIPSETLLTLPWGILISDKKKTDFHNLDYLLKRYALNYGYSSTLRFSNYQGTVTSDKILAIAPEYLPNSDSLHNRLKDVFRDEIVPLVWSTKEVEAIGRYFDIESITGMQATEKRFKESITNYSILHLAMHALVDNEESMRTKLIFSQSTDSLEDGYLHTFELFNMNLNADMAVLSACNTGLGNIEQGEGVISLASGFAYAGVPSVVMSHWNVDDYATSIIMGSFYKLLSQGYTKSEALRQSKLEYLKKAGPNKQHPFYWGAFVVLGDDSSVVKENSTEHKYYLILVAFALLVFGIGYRRKRRAKA